tara:strand:- start:797 stop:1030 length:234 start_codon:yes stop_codon:yes gene_type:complete
MKTLYNSLKPEYIEALESHAEKYPASVRAIKKALKNNSLWSRLTVQQVRDFITFSDNVVFETSYQDWAFGTKFLQNE